MRKTQLLTLSSEYQMDKTQVLGKGSTGEVYLGKQLTSGQPVAVKMIRLETIDNEVTQYLLKMEKIALSTVAHQNILKGLKIIQNSSKCYMITEFCNGGTLKNLIRKQGSLRQEKSLQIIKGILKGYSALVRKGIVHRDLKPANIMLHNNIPKIIDFGYCQIRGHQKPSLEYNVGSPSYMAPQSFENNVYNEKTEIWAIGIILYECLMGKTFDDGKHMSQIFKAMRKFGIPFGKEVSEKCRKIIGWCLEFEPSKRPTALELLGMLVENKSSQSAEFTVLNKTERKKVNSLYFNNFVSAALEKGKENHDKKIQTAESKNIYQTKQQVIQNVLKKDSRSKSKQAYGFVCQTQRNSKPNSELYQPNQSQQSQREKITSNYRVKNEYGLQRPSIPRTQKIFKGENIMNHVASQHITTFTSCKQSPREQLPKRAQKKISFTLTDKNPQTMRERLMSGHNLVDGYFDKNQMLSHRPTEKLGRLKMGIKKQNIEHKQDNFMMPNHMIVKKQSIYSSARQNYPEMRYSNSIYELNNYIRQKDKPISIFNSINIGQNTCR